MGFLKIQICLVLVACLSLISAATFISDGVFGSQVITERRLLQAQKPCPVNFEFQNYTIITSRCKGPEYAPNLCCPALVEFGCPFADDINDLSNDCATIMFSYIDRYGRYPPGLFANECRDNKEGLECPAQSPETAATNRLSNSNSGVQIVSGLLPVLMLGVASSIASLWLCWEF